MAKLKIKLNRQSLDLPKLKVLSKVKVIWKKPKKARDDSPSDDFERHLNQDILGHLNRQGSTSTLCFEAATPVDQNRHLKL